MLDLIYDEGKKIKLTEINFLKYSIKFLKTLLAHGTKVRKSDVGIETPDTMLA